MSNDTSNTPPQTPDSRTPDSPGVGWSPGSAFQRYTIPCPELTEEEMMRPSPVPIIPWRDYGKPRQG